MSSPVFRLFAGCVPVRGARRSTLCDLQRREIHLIPNGLHEIVTTHRDRTREELHALFGPGAAEVVDEYFAWLEEQELGFWCHDPESFPDLDLSWDAHERITNAIVDVDAASAHPFARIFEELDELGCRALQLRFFCDAPPERVHQALAPTAATRLRSVELIVKHGPGWSDDAIEALCRAHPRLMSVFVHSAPERRVHRVLSGTVPVVFRTHAVTSEAHCGEVHPAYFRATVPGFTEALAYNSCLNRKLAVDRRGEIRNCPALPRSFGNVADTSLHAAVLHRDFRELWEVNKDQVETCRDCEFRYVCTDCRAFVRDPGDRYSKPSKCTYDPYAATWEAPAPATVPAVRTAPAPASAAHA